MKKKIPWLRILFIIGLVSMIIGAIDPLEGSVVIFFGSILLTLSKYFSHDKHWKYHLLALILILFGVFFLFYLSNKGGFGGESSLSWWWGILILPYPIGWLISIFFVIFSKVKSNR